MQTYGCQRILVDVYKRQHRDGDDLALRETGDGNLVHLLQLLDEGADSGAVPMPASCQLGNGDYKLPVGKAELLLAQILGDVLYRSLVYKVKVGFEQMCISDRAI